MVHTFRKRAAHGSQGNTFFASYIVQKTTGYTSINMNNPDLLLIRPKMFANSIDITTSFRPAAALVHWQLEASAPSQKTIEQLIFVNAERYTTSYEAD